jgi:hypothetical protein
MCISSYSDSVLILNKWIYQLGVKTRKICHPPNDFPENLLHKSLSVIKVSGDYPDIQGPAIMSLGLKEESGF